MWIQESTIWVPTHHHPGGVRDTKQYIDWGELVRALLRGGGGGSWGVVSGPSGGPPKSVKNPLGISTLFSSITNHVVLPRWGNGFFPSLKKILPRPRDQTTQPVVTTLSKKTGKGSLGVETNLRDACYFKRKRQNEVKLK